MDKIAEQEAGGDSLAALCAFIYTHYPPRHIANHVGKKPDFSKIMMHDREKIYKFIFDINKQQAKKGWSE